jgi:hypothetical protein
MLKADLDDKQTNAKKALCLIGINEPKALCLNLSFAIETT